MRKGSVKAPLFTFVETDMKIAHFCTFAPNQCGMYHTAKDLIWGERQIGIDAQMIDAGVEKDENGKNKTFYGRCKEDGWLKTVDSSWTKDADIFVLHSIVPEEFVGIGKPIIVISHGRPESSFLLEHYKILGTWSSYYARARNAAYSAFVTFWPEYLPILETLLPKDRLFYVPAPANLNDFTPFGDVADIEGHGGSPNIIVADIWRHDVTPFNVIQAASLFQRKYCPTAKIHIRGLPTTKAQYIKVLLDSLQRTGCLGTAAAQVRDMASVYRAGDILVTPHVIATRVIREALACGLSIVAGEGCKHTNYTANPLDIEGFAAEINMLWENKKADFGPNSVEYNRNESLKFNPIDSANEMKKVFEYVLDKKSRKIFIDLGGHLGESVDRFYDEVPNADEYKIFTFEPEPDTFDTLRINLEDYPNVTCINKAAYTKTGQIDFYKGEANNNEGGTLLQGKVTGAVNYQVPLKVQSIHFCDWLKLNFTKDDYIVLKINIEGGEYPLMKQLLENNMLSWINKLYIHTHSHKLRDSLDYKMIEPYFAQQAKEQGVELVMRQKGWEKFDVQ